MSVVRCTECHRILLISDGQMVIDHPRLSGELVSASIQCRCGAIITIDIPAKFQEE